MKEKDWYRIKLYPHIGFPLKPRDKEWVEKYVKDSKKIQEHQFTPFIYRETKTRKYRKCVSEDGQKLNKREATFKKRSLYYASHLDSMIYSYYAFTMSEPYENKLCDFGIDKCVTAYRTIKHNDRRNKCSIDFAGEVFQYILAVENRNLVAITFDIKSFFDTLNHAYLKNKLKDILNTDMSGADEHYYKIFKSLTKFSYVKEKELFNLFKRNIWVKRCNDLNPKKIDYKQKKITSLKYLKNQAAVAFCKKEDIPKIRSRKLIKSNKREETQDGRYMLRDKGIPQGSPMSSLLANIYMIDFDKQINDFVSNLSGGGIYRRYSDDMVVVCDPVHETCVIDEISKAIGSVHLEIQTSKTQIFYFDYHAGKKRHFSREKNIKTNNTSNNSKFEYLGFQFDGFYCLLKNTSLAKFYRKMKRNIARRWFYTHHNTTENRGKLFKNRLYKSFTHLGARRRLIYKRNRDDKSKFDKTKKMDWGNFLSYAYLAHKYLPNSKIKKQVKKHWKIFHLLINSLPLASTKTLNSTFMKVLLREIKVDEHALTPTLLVALDLQFMGKIEAPISVSGYLSDANKKIALLSENIVNSDSVHSLCVLSSEEEKAIRENKNRSSYYCQLSGELSSHAIEYIEREREKRKGKNVVFVINLVFKYLKTNPDSSGEILQVITDKSNDIYTIEHSKWIKEFAPTLGIGNFLLLELRIPEEREVPDFWKELYKKLSENVKDMEKTLREGDWEKTMLFARKFYENAKIGDKKDAHKELKKKFNELMSKDQHTPAGIENFYEAVWKLFDFYSKYIHDQNQEGFIVPTPKCGKEDAYFAYSVAVGLLNLIGKKISEQDWSK